MLPERLSQVGAMLIISQGKDKDNISYQGREQSYLVINLMRKGERKCWHAQINSLCFIRLTLLIEISVDVPGAIKYP